MTTNKCNRVVSRWLLLVVIAFFAPVAHLCADAVNVDLLSGNWKLNKGDEYPGAVGSFTCDPDTKMLQLNYDFTKGGQYINVFSALPPAGDLSGLKIDVKGYGGEFTVTLVDATDQVLIYRCGMVGDNMQSFDVPLATPSDGYGGAKDKKPHYPLKEIRLTVEKGAQLQGKLTFRSVTMETVPAPASTP